MGATGGKSQGVFKCIFTRAVWEIAGTGTCNLIETGRVREPHRYTPHNKPAEKKGAWRTQEKTLHLLSLSGGLARRTRRSA